MHAQYITYNCILLVMSHTFSVKTMSIVFVLEFHLGVGCPFSATHCFTVSNLEMLENLYFITIHYPKN